jgi:hypothetical protein
VLPGKMDDWVTIMETEIIPFQVSKGMVITASYRGETDEAAYVWLRRFESEEQRVQQYKAVYESDYWEDDDRTKVGRLAGSLEGGRDPACADAAFAGAVRGAVALCENKTRTKDCNAAGFLKPGVLRWFR